MSRRTLHTYLISYLFFHKGTIDELKVQLIKIAPDWRKIQGSKLLELINKLEPLENLEVPMKDVQLEHNTVYAV